MDFGAAIAETRNSKGLSRAEVAESAGIAPSSLASMEWHGSGTVAQMEKVLDALEIRWSGLPRHKRLSTAVKHLREKRGWSQEKLCERAGVSVPALIRLEKLGERSRSVRLSTLSRCLDILAPTMRVRREHKTPWVYQGKDHRYTPKNFLDRVRTVVGPISLDPCAHRSSPVKARKYFYEEDDGLAQSWAGSKVVFVNPPYSNMAAFLRKANSEWRSGACETIFLLLPNRMHQVVWRETITGSAACFVLTGRVRYIIGPNEDRTAAPFGNVIAIFGETGEIVERMLRNFNCVYVPPNSRVGIDRSKFVPL